MSVFTPAEIAYMQGQRLARVATATPDGQPHVVPRIAIVIDDLASVDPWRPRMLEVRGEAAIVSTGGEAIGSGFDPEMFRIRPKRIISIGVDASDQPFALNARSV